MNHFVFAEYLVVLINNLLFSKTKRFKNVVLKGEDIKSLYIPPNFPLERCLEIADDQLVAFREKPPQFRIKARLLFLEQRKDCFKHLSFFLGEQVGAK